EIAVVGQDAYAYAGAIRQRYLPNKILAATIIPNNEIPLLAGKSAASNTFIYVCRDFICRQPVVSLEAFWEQVQAGTH
ncbi:MAG: thioredoxin domain-containing protein, partial [Bacteroidetes bacterium]|nr:thioredoxin domain-containing protein [Bacteroidota bacterium]